MSVWSVNGFHGEATAVPPQSLKLLPSKRHTSLLLTLWESSLLHGHTAGEGGGNAVLLCSTDCPDAPALTATMAQLTDTWDYERICSSTVSGPGEFL